MAKVWKILLSVCCISLLLYGCKKPDLGWSWNLDTVKSVLSGGNSKDERDIVSTLDTIENSLQAGDVQEFVFKEKDVKTKPSLGTKAKYIRQVYMYLGEGLYYPVDIPDTLEYVTDNSKYIYAKDGSLSVSVVSNLDIYSFSAAAFIQDAETKASNLIVSKEGKKGPQEAAIFIVNDKAIIVRCYDAPDVYETILYGLEHNIYYQSKYNCVRTEDLITVQLNELPVYTGFHMRVYAGLGDSLQKVYTFDNDTLTISKELRQFETVKELQGTKLAVIAESDVANKVYESENTYYVEIGDYTLGVYKINYNTCFTAFGKGDEVRYNIVEFLRAQN